MTTTKKTAAQIERQLTRKAGKYSKLNPCRSCGKSAGADYCSDERLGVKGEVLCEKCADRFAEMSDAEIAAARA